MDDHEVQPEMQHQDGHDSTAIPRDEASLDLLGNHTGTRSMGPRLGLHRKNADPSSIGEHATRDQVINRPRSSATTSNNYNHPAVIKKSKMFLGVRTVYWIIIIIFVLAGLAVFLFFLITGSKNLDSSLNDVSDQLNKINASNTVVEHNLDLMNTANTLANQNLGLLKTANDATAIDLDKYTAAQTLLTTTLSNISAAASALATAIKPSA